MDVDPDGFEVLSNQMGERLGLGHGVDQFGLSLVGGGFEVIDMGAALTPTSKSALPVSAYSEAEVQFDPTSVGVTAPLSGALFYGPGPEMFGNQLWLHAAVTVVGRGAQARFGDVLIYAIGKVEDTDENGAFDSVVVLDDFPRQTDCPASLAQLRADNPTAPLAPAHS